MKFLISGFLVLVTTSLVACNDPEPKTSVEVAQETATDADIEKAKENRKKLLGTNE